jgi:hypothetical protein
MKSAGVVITQSFGSEPPLPFDKSAAQHGLEGVQSSTDAEPITSANAQAKVTIAFCAHTPSCR